MKKAWIALALAALLVQPACAGAQESSDERRPAAQAPTAKSSVKKKSKARRSAEKSCKRKLRKQGRKVGAGAKPKDRAAFRRCVAKKLKRRGSRDGNAGDGGQTTAPTPTTPKPGGSDTLDPGQY
jgi:hypothetical protein